ncbi:MAG: 4Fe-4S dicluster domain-containing protein [Desulfitobacteriaceae bacterium]
MNICQIKYQPEKCLNTKKPFAQACRLCIEACPHQAISENWKLDSGKCTECGACMAVCPSGAFVDRTLDKLHDYLFTADPVVLNCPLAAPQGFEIACLGILNRDFWSLLIILAGSKPVSILTGNCAECPDKQACAISVQTFIRLHVDWVEHSPVQIVVCPDSEDKLLNQSSLPNQSLSSNPEVSTSKNSLRDVLGSLRRNSLESVERFLPSMRTATTSGLNQSLTRNWLVEALHSLPEVVVTFLTLEVAENCTNCGVCVVICPEAALEKQEKDGKLALWLEPWKCVQCKRCVEICRPKALSIKPHFFLGHQLVGKQLLHEGYPQFCSRCGKKIFDKSTGALCVACATSEL